MKKNILIPGLSLAVVMIACNSSSNNRSTTDSSGINNDTAVTMHTDTGRVMNTDTAMNNNNNENADFLTDAAGGGMMEVTLGNLAKTHAASKAVKDFGALMVRDHSNLNSQLKSVAAK